MSDFRRYAIYHLPDEPDLAKFGARWLGWDVRAGRETALFDVDGLERVTDSPRRYGFHGTLKPPFRLTEGTTSGDLVAHLNRFASETPAVHAGPLRLARLGHFLALVPAGHTDSLHRLAFDIVQEFDRYRRPSTDAELDRRRTKGLTDRQEAYLARWGYPYVGEDFRFHYTLTSRLSETDLSTFEHAASELLPKLPDRLSLRSVALLGEDDNGNFHLVQHVPLTGMPKTSS